MALFAALECKVLMFEVQGIGGKETGRPKCPCTRTQIVGLGLDEGRYSTTHRPLHITSSLPFFHMTSQGRMLCLYLKGMCRSRCSPWLMTQVMECRASRTGSTKVQLYHRLPQISTGYYRLPEATRGYYSLLRDTTSVIRHDSLVQ